MVALTAALVALTSGCLDDGRPARVAISGRITLDGQPVQKGSVSFVPVEGGRPSGSLIFQGAFILSCYDENDGCLLGPHYVTVVSNDLLGGGRVRWLAPKKYAAPTTTDIEYVVQQAEDDVHIELSSEKPPFKPFVEVL